MADGKNDLPPGEKGDAMAKPAPPRAGKVTVRLVTGELKLQAQPATVRFIVDEPAVLIQAAVVEPRGKTEEGELVVAVGDVWRRIVRDLQRDPTLLHGFAQNSRLFEEFIAATYDESGEWDEVILTPRSGDGGRDVIVVRKGFGALRFLEQCKAYSPGHLVTHNDVRAMLGVLARDQAASKGIITTTSDFAPGVLAGDEFAPFMPTRLEVRNGVQLQAWLDDIEGRKQT